jgi:hypothetical protein
VNNHSGHEKLRQFVPEAGKTFTEHRVPLILPPEGDGLGAWEQRRSKEPSPDNVCQLGDQEPKVDVNPLIS